MSVAEVMLCSFQEGQKRPDSFHLVLLEPLFLECSLLEPICRSVKIPLVGILVAVPGDLAVEASISPFE